MSELNTIQTADLGRYFSMKKKIAARKIKKQPSDQMENKLKSLIEKSAEKTQQNKSIFESITLEPGLPITAEGENIKSLVKQHQVVIVAGETGCGKTTQLPKILMQAGIGARGLIGHTQPRRVAATSVAKRIADELKSPIGRLVGYSVRFNEKTSEATRLKLMTDGILLAELESDPLLSRYEAIIIDEAHERSLNIDFLLGFLKQIITRRKDFKIIVTSATIEPEKFAKHFGGAPIVTVEGRSYPVEVRYRPIEEEDNDNDSTDPILNAVSAAVDECESESNGDILIFSDGEGQIKNIVKHLQKGNLSNTEIMPLYARLSINEQQRIFAPSGKRKIIVSTNVAETSLTVPGIIFVIDIGTARVSRFSQRNKIQQLPVEKVSKASADQRKGRCGRVANGICIRLYSEEDFNLREDFTCSEIQRTNLSSVLLKLLSMKVKDVELFPFMEAPDDRAWKTAFNTLFELGAINKKNLLTDIGLNMAKLPVDPQLARILVQPKLIAVDEMLIICSLMSVREVRERPHDKQQKADSYHKQYQQDDSDVLTAIKLWRDLDSKKSEMSSNGFKKWCRENFINFLGWLEWRKVYFQLKESVESLGVKVNQQHQNKELVHRALIPGFVTHIFTKTNEPYYQGVRGLKVWIHPSSLSFKKNTPWLLSCEMIETEKLYARMNCELQPKWIAEDVPHLLKNHYQDIHWSKKRGQAVAYLNQTLLGLPIVNKQVINYSNVDLEKSRQLLIAEGLAGDQMFEDFPFLKANRQKLESLLEQEQRQRLNNICIHKDELTALYHEVLPEHIVSAISLKRWLKKDYKARNAKLTFSIKQLTHNPSKSIDDYPSEIIVKGVSLPLSYSFAPGTAEDGVTVELPENMVRQFTQRDFDWLVPGLLEEKILATLKTLPKVLRRDLIPLNETAARCYDELISIDRGNKRFLDELAKVLQRFTGKQIKLDDFDADAVEPYLSMKFKVVNPKKRNQFKRYEKIADIKTQAVGHSNIHSKSVSGIKTFYQWEFDSFELEKISTQNKMQTRIFQALTEHNAGVVIKEYANKTLAQEAQVYGLAKLVMLKNDGLLNQFFNSWPDRKVLEMLSIRFDGFRGIFDNLVLKWLSVLIQKHHMKDKYLAKDFDEINQRFAKNFRVELSKLLNDILPLVKQRESIFSQIADLNPKAFKDSIEDLRLQLKQLWSKKFILISGSEMVVDYKRYLQACAARIKRLQTNYPKEQDAMDTWSDWFQWYKELEPELSVLSQAEVAKLIWSLEEFRISLFSPGVKVKGGISSKKLQKLFDEMEDKINIT